MQERMHRFHRGARMRTEGIMATPAYRAADHMAPQSAAAAVRLAVDTPLDRGREEDLAIRPAGMRFGQSAEVDGGARDRLRPGSGPPAN